MVNEKGNKSHCYDYIVAISWVSMALEFLLPFPLMHMSGEMLTERMALCSHDQGWSLLVIAHCEEDPWGPHWLWAWRGPTHGKDVP